MDPLSSNRAERKRPAIAVVGNPNVGKSTVFNALTGLRQKVANYPGVTVERRLGILTLDHGEVHLVDLPGMYSLSAQSPDEMVALDVLLGRIPDLGTPDAVVIVADASNLRRNLFLASQILDLELPVLVALNMMDVARSRGIALNVNALEHELQCTVIPVVASRPEGIGALRSAMDRTLRHPRASRLALMPAIKEATGKLADEFRPLGRAIVPHDIERALIDEGGLVLERLRAAAGAEVAERLSEARAALGFASESLAAADARCRYEWINRILAQAETRSDRLRGWSDRVDRLVSHPLLGTALFLGVMALVFQAVFSWATPMVDGIDALTRYLGEFVSRQLPEGALASLIVDGMIAGVGSVVVFLPQILILSVFIILLEDSGYMARAAFLMDRLMRFCGLSGQSFIPMLSSFACAVPGIMATRVIADPRDRLATILAAPFMTCSARLPVYTLLISAFVPDKSLAYGLLSLQGLVLLGLYVIGILGGVGTALLLKRTVLRGPAPAFLMELPPYRWPRLRSVVLRLVERMRVFLVRAGGIIFTVAVIVWALAYFPHPSTIHHSHERQRLEAAAKLSGDALTKERQEIDNHEAAAFLEQSALGRIGKTVEPFFSPLGWDWKVAAAVIASFPAREVVIAVLGTIYSVGSDVDPADNSLSNRLQNASWPDGRKVFSFSMALGLMLFYAFCLQCTATVAIIKRETNSWRWAGFAWVYMTTIGYLSAFMCFQFGTSVA
ncbi:MAG: ferrous iron transport protein B [Gammaproteobacteria bacterium]